MFYFFKQCLYSRRAWLLLALTSSSLEMISLWLQNSVGLQPCIFCIYESFALLGIVVSGLIGVIAPKTLLRYIALFLWIYSSCKGVELAWKHSIMQMYPSKIMICDLFIDFPDWMPCKIWFEKKIATANGCFLYQWRFLKLLIPQWLLIIFSIYISVAVSVLILHFYCLLSKVYSFK